MQLKCKLIPTKTLADLEPGVVAETELGLRWRDANNFVLGVGCGYPSVMNSNISGQSPAADQYTITGEVLGKIKMVFEI